MRKLRVLLVLLAFSVLATAASSISDLGDSFEEQMMQVVDLLKNIVPIISLALFIFAGLVYAIGQVFDAQTRHKAQNWALAMITGGIIGFLLVLVAPYLVEFLMGFSG